MKQRLRDTLSELMMNAVLYGVDGLTEGTPVTAGTVDAAAEH